MQGFEWREVRVAAVEHLRQAGADNALCLDVHRALLDEADPLLMIRSAEVARVGQALEELVSRSEIEPRLRVEALASLARLDLSYALAVAERLVEHACSQLLVCIVSVAQMEHGTARAQRILCAVARRQDDASTEPIAALAIQHLNDGWLELGRDLLRSKLKAAVEAGVRIIARHGTREDLALLHEVRKRRGLGGALRAQVDEAIEETVARLGLSGAAGGGLALIDGSGGELSEVEE